MDINERVIKDGILVEEELKFLAQARAVLERYRTTCDASRRSLYNCQRALRLEKDSKLKQGSFLDHLYMVEMWYDAR